MIETLEQEKDEALANARYHKEDASAAIQQVNHQRKSISSPSENEHIVSLSPQKMNL